MQRSWVCKNYCQIFKDFWYPLLHRYYDRFDLCYVMSLPTFCLTIMFFRFLFSLFLISLIISLMTLSYVSVTAVIQNQHIICFWIVIFSVLFGILFAIGSVFLRLILLLFWIKLFSSSASKLRHSLMLSIWLFCVWTIWKERSNRIFNHKESTTLLFFWIILRWLLFGENAYFLVDEGKSH